MAEICPWQKWSISYLFEHFLVDQIPIWLDFVLGFNIDLMNAKYSLLNTRTQKCFQNVMDKQLCDACARKEPTLQFQRILEFESCDTCTITEPILQT